MLNFKIKLKNLIINFKNNITPKKVFTVFNYVFPVVMLFVLILTINSLLNGYSIALKVSFNGKEIGYIESNEIYKQAFNDMEKKMMGVENVYSSLDAPSYTLTVIRKNELLSSSDLSDKMLETTYGELADAVGVYYGSELIGVALNEDDLKNSINDFLKIRSEDLNEDLSIEFVENITYQYGLYPVSTIISKEEFSTKINTPYYITTKYVTVRNDTYESVAQMFNMEYTKLLTLNSDIYTSSPTLKAGTYLSVLIPKYPLETQFYKYNKYTDRLAHGIVQKADPSHYIGYSSVSSAGVDGLEELSVKEIIKDGEVIDTIVLSRSTILEPVNEIVTIGTKNTGNINYLTKYFWPTKTKGFFISAFYGDDRNHKGMDIAIPVNTEIFASDDGIVTTSAFDVGGYGYYVIITHSDGYKTVYGHCETLLVNVGDTVSRGDLIAYSGNTGKSTGPHLHFEVRYNGDRIDPAPFLGVSEVDGSIGAIPKE